jgi:hypothetical protein
MGFNIGVYSEQMTNNSDCRHFIDRMFYNFVNSGEQYGDESILIQSGRYYGMDLSALLKLVYTWDEVTKDYIKANIQNTGYLLNLVVDFRNSIEQNRPIGTGSLTTSPRFIPAPAKINSKISNLKSAFCKHS